MKKSVIMFLLASMSLTASAQDPEKVGDYWYKISPYSWQNGGVTLVKDPTGKDYSGNIVIPNEIITADGVTRTVIGIGERAFSGTSIMSVTIKGKVDEYGDAMLSIGERAFSLCKSLSSVTIGEGVSRIDDYAFYGCENLASVVVGDNVYRIGWQAFQNCSSLTTVFLGKSLRYIGASSFVDCPQLKDVYCYGDYSPSQSGGRIFKDDQLKDLTLHVPEACYDNYIFDGADNYPWQHFGKTETVTSTTVEKCAKPTISYENGTVSFACETEGVEFNSTVEYLEESFNNVSAFPAPSKFRVKVVAVKNGYLASEIAEEKFDLPSYVGVKTDGYEQGDENKDGKVNVADHVKLSNIMVDK